MHHSPELDLDIRCQMPTDQWRGSLMHWWTPTARQLPFTVCDDSRLLVLILGSVARCCSSRRYAPGLTTPWHLPRRSSCATLQCVSPGLPDLLSCCGICAAAVKLCAWPLSSLPTVEALQRRCDRVTIVSLYHRSSTNKSAQSTPPTHPLFSHDSKRRKSSHNSKKVKAQNTLPTVCHTEAHTTSLLRVARGHLGFL